MVDVLTGPRHRRHVSQDTMTLGQQRVSESAVLLAIEYVKTRMGVERIYKAELGGLKRPMVIANAARRMESFHIQRTPHSKEN